ncbi:Ubiquitin carboxyl-terminal hydrolase 48 [Lamellibrachia satsuma]|nr:Ubiquitin carboxyl-terminal hydrolase 48 [Lamellibrachia satsuma]
MVPKQRLDKLSWQWAEAVEPDEVQWKHVELAYRVGLNPCKPGTCRRNCKGNPFCLLGLGERDWLCEIDDSNWHDIDDPEVERRKKGGFVGLKNLGATCYVNTFLQVSCLYKTKDGQQQQQQESQQQEPQQQQLSPAGDIADGVPPNSVIGQLQLIFAMLQFSDRKFVDPTPFINALGLDAGQQQDAQEFSKLLMSLLEDTFRQQHDAALRNVIQTQFLGHYDYVTRCTACNSESHQSSKFYELDLNIKGHSTLKDCIQEFLKEEKLDGDNQYMCAVCNGKQNAVRQIELCSLPPVLNFQLLRFVFDRKTGCKRKLNTYIQFPEILDMSVYVSRPDEEVLYDLQAVLIHRGPSANSGHYISYICDFSSNLWYKFNDEDIEQMGGKNLQLGNEDELHLSDGNSKAAKKPRTGKGFHASRNAYMLVYRQRHSRESERVMGEPQLSSLPEPVQCSVEMDNAKFEQWIDEMKNMREISISQGKARHTEVFQLYHVMPVVKGEPWEWIDTKWLTKWFYCDYSTDVPVVNNSALLCPHSRLHPDKVPNAKCISKKAVSI